MRINLSHPSNWSDFQDLCADLWRELMGDMQSHQNGRIGQSQNGVDFYGKYPNDRTYTGVQCKGKNGNYGSALTIAEIDSECKKAKNFVPQLGTFIMATTSPRDVNIQEHCRNLTDKKTYPFSVDTWAWEDIEDEVQSRQSLMNKYYPSIEEINLVTELKLSRTMTSAFQRIHAYFSRPLLFGSLNKVALEILEHLAYEIAINAFEHGNAITFTINIEESTINLIDNGNQFNPLDLIGGQIRGRGGMHTISYASKLYKLHYDYDKRNVLTIDIPKNLFANLPQDKYSITFDANEVLGRSEANALAINKLSEIPNGTETLIIDITGKINPAISTSYAFFDRLVSLKPNVNQIIVYIPFDLYYKDSLIAHYSDIENLCFKSKD